MTLRFVWVCLERLGMQLSQISSQICSFGLTCNELNFILPVLHSQLAIQNLNSFNNSPNHPIRLIIKA